MKKMQEFINVLEIANSSDVLRKESVEIISRNCDTDSEKKKQESAINLLEKEGLRMSHNPIIDENKGKDIVRQTIGNNVFWTLYDCDMTSSLKKYMKGEGLTSKNSFIVLKKGMRVYLSDSSFPLDEELCFQFLSERKTDKNPNPEKGLESKGRTINGKKMELFINPLRFPEGITFRIKKK